MNTNTLHTLIDDARALAQDAPASASAPTSTTPHGHAATDTEAEAARILQICNACRYCEGFCAVFPAMTRRLSFAAADLHYMANLCHNCGACLHACQYAPPHDFGVNVPQTLARLRGQTYQDYAWPRPLGALYKRNGLVMALALAIGLALFLWLAARLHGDAAGVAGTASIGSGAETGTTDAAPTTPNFYGIFPHNLLVALFAPVFLWSVFALGMGVRCFLRRITPVTGTITPIAEARREAAASVLTLRYLDGGHGDGCHNADDAYTLARRHAHHLTFYGFLLCFAATGVATLYHYLFGWVAPYDLPSLPKLLGVTGGILMTLGCAALLVLNLRRHPLHGDAAQKPMDLGFIALLLLISVSGLGLWLARGQAAMPLWLCVHLGAVMALFLTLPYGKMAHGFYRSAALLRHAVEKRLPNPIGLGSD